jgi:SAM-dependent MidA family methyltransferase
MSILEERIREEIRRHGPAPFRRFMEMALYEPGLGYYERAVIGRAGDFQTSASVGPLFGGLLAWQFAEWLESAALAGVARPMIVEAGAHDGTLAADILRSLGEWRPELAGRVVYVCREPSEERRRPQRAVLAPWSDQVRWIGSWEELGAKVCGIIFSNELLDAIPFHRFAWNREERRWRELGVGLGEGQFVWQPLPENSVEFAPGLPAALEELLPDGFLTEHSPAAEHWWKEAAGALGSGKLAAFDYGLDEPEFFAPHRSTGTARAYHRHRLITDLLRNPGEQDLTAHVNFTRIRQGGEEAGLETETETDQGRFLTGVLLRLQQSGRAAESWITSRAAAFQTLTHPSHFGSSFRVLVQGRGMTSGE